MVVEVEEEEEENAVRWIRRVKPGLRGWCQAALARTGMAVKEQPCLSSAVTKKTPPPRLSSPLSSLLSAPPVWPRLVSPFTGRVSAPAHQNASMVADAPSTVFPRYSPSVCFLVLHCCPFVPPVVVAMSFAVFTLHVSIPAPCPHRGPADQCSIDSRMLPPAARQPRHVLSSVRGCSGCHKVWLSGIYYPPHYFWCTARVLPVDEHLDVSTTTVPASRRFRSHRPRRPGLTYRLHLGPASRNCIAVAAPRRTRSK